MFLSPIPDPDAFGIIAVIYLVIILIILTPQYIMDSLALHKIARRRKIENHWLAWIPLGKDWVRGCISDQYQQVVCGKVKQRRMWLPLLYGLSALAYIVGLVLVFVALALYPAGQDVTVHPPVDSIGAVVAMSVVLLAGTGCSIAAAIIMWLSTYDLFRSCDPEQGKAYTIISLVIALVFPSFAVIKEILQLVVAGNDRGMQPLQTPPWEAWEEPQIIDDCN